MASFYQVQGQDFFLDGSGITATATSIVLVSMTYPNGNANIVTADIGAINYATLEPATAREENISFTGITQNANGSATLTGVTRGLKPFHPYTADTTLRIAHAGDALIRLTNSGPFYAEFGIKRNDETVPGAWTFSQNVTVPALPVAATDATSKEYVDAAVTSASGNTDCLVTKHGSNPTLLVDVNSGYIKPYTDTQIFAGASSQTVVDNATNYVQLSPSATLVIRQDAFGDGYISLAKVITSGGTITSVEDARAFLVSTSQSVQVYQFFTYGTTIAIGDPVYPDPSTGKLLKCLATTAATADGFIGVALEAGVLNDTGKRVLISGICSNGVGLTSNAPVYISNTGTFSPTAGTYKKEVGWAFSGVSFLLHPGLRAEDISGGNTDLTTANLNASATFIAGSPSPTASSLVNSLTPGYVLPILSSVLSGGGGDSFSSGYSDASTPIITAYLTQQNTGSNTARLVSIGFKVAVDLGVSLYADLDAIAEGTGADSKNTRANIFIGPDNWTGQDTGNANCIFKNGGTAVTISGTAPTTTALAFGHNPTSSLLLVQDATNRIRQYSGIAGTTITHTTDITLSVASSLNARSNFPGFIYDNVHSRYILIDTTANLIRRYDSTGTQLDTAAYTIDDSNVVGVVMVDNRVYIAVSLISLVTTDSCGAIISLIPTTMTR